MMGSASAGAGMMELPCLPGWYNNKDCNPDLSIFLKTTPSDISDITNQRSSSDTDGLQPHHVVGVHAVFIASYSKYFRARIQNSNEFKQPATVHGVKVLEEVFHSDAEVCAAEVVLRFMYEGRLEEGVVHDVEQLLRAYMVADRWEVPCCLNACKATIKNLVGKKPQEQALSPSAINAWYSMRLVAWPSDLRSAVDAACKSQLREMLEVPQQVLDSEEWLQQFCSLHVGPVLEGAAAMCQDAATAAASQKMKALLLKYCESSHGQEVLRQLEQDAQPLLVQLEGLNVEQLMRLADRLLALGGGPASSPKAGKVQALLELATKYVVGRLGDIPVTLGNEDLMTEVYSLDPESVALLLSRDELKVTSEDDVLVLAKMYIREKEVLSAQQQEKLMDQIRMRQLSPVFLYKVVPVHTNGHQRLQNAWADVMYSKMMPHLNKRQRLGPPAWHAGPRSGGPSSAPTSLTLDITMQQLQGAEVHLGPCKGDVSYVHSEFGTGFVFGGLHWSPAVTLQRLAPAPGQYLGGLTIGLCCFNEYLPGSTLSKESLMIDYELKAKCGASEQSMTIRHAEAQVGTGSGWDTFFTAPDGRSEFSGVEDPGLQHYLHGEPPAMTVTVRLLKLHGMPEPPMYC